MERAITFNEKLMAEYSVETVYIRYLSKNRKNHVNVGKEIYQDVRDQWAEAENYRLHNRINKRPIADNVVDSTHVSDLSKNRRDHVKIWKVIYEDVRCQWVEAEHYRPRIDEFTSQETIVSKAAGRDSFFGSFLDCMAHAWKDADEHYYIPKSRFGESTPEGGEHGSSPRQKKTVPRNAFLGAFRDCVGKAWEEADTLYNIPKSRFGDPEYNQSAYTVTQVQGVLGRVGPFLRGLGSCISTAWVESDHYYHLPKSRYRDPSFVREKMAKAPKPKGRLVVQPLIIGMGVVGEGIEDGWLASSPRNQPDDEFIIPEDGAVANRKPELESE